MKSIFRSLLAFGILAVALQAGAASPDRSQWRIGDRHTDVSAEVKANPDKSGGIYYAYPVVEDQAFTLPKGYRPAGMVHYGRHGSRWILKDYLTFLPQMLLAGEEAHGNLTALGKDVKARVERFSHHAKGHLGELSPLGERQHKAIARRMYERFPSLFADTTFIEARSSTEQRCIISMAAFCEQLKELNPSLRVQRHATPGDMDFIALNTPAVKADGRPDAPWREDYWAFADSVINPDRLLASLFIDPQAALSRDAMVPPMRKGREDPNLLNQLSDRRKGGLFARMLVDIAVAIQDVDGLEGLTLYDIFTPEELFNVWQTINYEMYYRHALADGTQNSGPLAAETLLERFVAQGDSAVAAGKPYVSLHFGHDTNLIHFLSLIGLKGAAGVATSPADYYKTWQDFRVAPMGANFQLALFTSDTGEPIALLRHNEQTAKVDLPNYPKGTDFYRWSDLKRFWAERLADLKPSKGEQAVYDLIDRIATGASGRFVIVEQPGKEEFFEITAINGRPAIVGNNPVNIAAGLNWYLKYYTGNHLAWNNMTAQLPEVLPLPEKPERHSTYADRRYYLNYCTHSYSMAFWDWERWQKEIDWMALHGINMPLAITGTDVVWRNVLRRLGYSEAEIAEFIAGPAFQAWWLMSNLEGWGGPNSEQWYADREKLQRNILARMRELGMEPVLPGYSGMVPHDADERLGLNVSGKGVWNGYTRPGFLATTDPRFDEIADLYYEELTRLNGRSKFYSMDPFHEGGSKDGVDLAQAGATIARAMKRANPEAVWVIQGWNENPDPELLKGVKPGDIMVLDLASEIKPNWGDPTSPSPYNRPTGYAPHDWTWNMVLNFGGNIGLHGRMDNVIDGYYRARDSKYAKTLRGVGLTPEGIENNPVMYELASELIWRQERFTKEDWLKGYTRARYGRNVAAADSAWQLLGATIYNCPWGNLQQGTTESVFCARPHMHIWQVSSWSKMAPYYNPQDVIDAAGMFLAAADSLAGSPNYRFDLVDIMRQAVAEKGRLTYQKMTEAIRNKDAKAFDTAADRFLTLLRAQDRLLNTTPDFKVGKWIADARRLAPAVADQDLLEENARVQITTWGRRQASEKGKLRDYAHREWAGTLGDLYHDRWSRWIEQQRRLLAAGIPPMDLDEDLTKVKKGASADYVTAVSPDANDGPIVAVNASSKALLPDGTMRPDWAKMIDFYPIDEAWVNSRNAYSAVPEGVPIDIARQTYRLLLEP